MRAIRHLLDCLRLSKAQFCCVGPLSVDRQGVASNCGLGCLPLPRHGLDHPAPFSAIMIVGALVLVELTAGMIEASMTRKASSPCTWSWSSPTLIAGLRLMP